VNALVIIINVAKLILMLVIVIFAKSRVKIFIDAIDPSL